MDENKTNDQIFAEALIQIIDNQIDIKKHLGIIRDRDTSYYGDCYFDGKVIDALRTIE